MGSAFAVIYAVGFWVFLFFLASILWLAGRSAGYSRIALVAFSLHFCCRKLEVFMLTVMKLIKHKQYSDTSQCIWRKGKCNFPRFGWSKAKSYFINFKQINIYNLLLVPSVSSPGLSVSIIFSFLSLVFVLPLVTFQERKMFKKILSLEPFCDPSWWHFMACFPHSLCKSSWHSVRTWKMFSQFESAKIFKVQSVWLPLVSNHLLRVQLLQSDVFLHTLSPGFSGVLSPRSPGVSQTLKNPHSSYFLQHFCYVHPGVTSSTQGM